MRKAQLLLFLQFFIFFAQSQFTQTYQAQKVFVKNVGQFDYAQKGTHPEPILYAYDGFSEDYFFTQTAVKIILEKKEYAHKKEDAKERERELKKMVKDGMTAEQHAAMEREEHRIKIQRDELIGEWVGANSNAQIEMSEAEGFTYGYSFVDKTGAGKSESGLTTYKVLTYKNLYPNIDVKYELHANKGLKYTVIVRPGGNLSQVKLRYSKNAKLKVNGTIETVSMYGKIIDHAPISFYEGTNEPVSSRYTLQNNEIGFSAPNYDNTKTLVIDPWTQTPNFNTVWDCVWECDKDAAGNAYLIGGIMPLQLLKYNSAGVLQWTYTTPYDTSNTWLGNFAVDNAGNSYVTEGTGGGLQKINTSGALVWNNNAAVGGLLTEFWSIAFNCDQTKLLIGGTGGTGLTPQPYLYDVNLNNGNVSVSARVTGGALFPTQEVRAITACGNGKYYFLTHDSVGYIHQSLTSCVTTGGLPFHTSNSYGLSYKCENFRRDNTGIAAIKYWGGFVYTHKGSEVHKRDFNTGAIIATGVIPGGQFSGGAVRNSGIDIDDCGNVFVGSTNAVVKFNSNLVQQSSYATLFNVYDVAVSTSGDVIAAGTTGNSGSGARTGYIQSFAATACAPQAIICCDATVCQVPTKCTSDPAVTLVATTAGGTFSGPGVTGSSFNPAAAGIGVHTIKYTLACGSDSIKITVNSCAVLNVCKESNGQFTVTGGTGPYTWSVWDSISRTCSGTVLAGNCFGTWTTNYGWRNFGSGTTVTSPSGKDTIRVTDNSGGVYTSYNKNTIPLCNPCNLAIQTKTVTQPSCGLPNGSISVTMTGGTLPYTYTWTPNVSNTNTASNLAAGSYQVVITAGAGCTKDTTFNLTGTTAPNINSITKTDELCQGQNNGAITAVNTTGGSPTYTYGYAPSSNPTAITPIASFPLNNLAPGTYILGVQDANSCRDTFWFTIAAGPVCCNLAIQTKTVTQTSCGLPNGSISVTMTGGTLPYSYAWTPNVSSTNAASNLAAGSYQVVITAGAGCTKDTTFSLTGTTVPNINSITKTDELCQGQNNGAITAVNTTGGTPTYTYGYAPSSNPTAITPIASFPLNNLAPGTYILGVQDANSCRDTFWFTVAAGPNCCNVAIPTATITQPTCGQNNGAISISVTGGTMPYTYTWTPNVSTTNAATNLAAGAYRISVQAGVNCSIDTLINLNSNSSLSLTLSNQVNPTCAGSNGQVTVALSGGTAPYQVTIDTGATPQTFTLPFAVTQTLTNLPAGTISVTIVDAANCTITRSVTLIAPTPPNINSIAKTDEQCANANDGVLTSVNTTGGNGSYTYSVANSTSPSTFTALTFPQNGLADGTYILRVQDGNSCSDTFWFTINAGPVCCNLNMSAVLTNPACGLSNGSIDVTPLLGSGNYTYAWTTGGQTTQDLSSIGVGNYTITLTDATQGCSKDSTFTLANINGPIIDSVQKRDETCPSLNNGSIRIFASGGVGALTYTWSPVLSNSPNQTNLSPGTYSYTVQDGNNCQVTGTRTVAPGTNPTVVLSTTNPDCAGNNGSISVSGSPAGSFQYVLNGTTTNTTGSFNNLAAGSYVIAITDSKGCSITQNATLTAPTPFVASLTGQNISCAGANDGSATIPPITGGTAPFTFAWSNNAVTQNITNLTAGTYTVTISDASNCSAVLSTTITEPAPISVNLGNDTILCGQSLVLNAQNSGNSYQWSTSETTQQITVINSGRYSVTVSGAGGCSASATINIELYPLVTLDLRPDTSIYEGETVWINTTLTGGSGFGTYSWTPTTFLDCTSCPQPYSTPNDTVTYFATYIDDAGCSATDAVIIYVNKEFSFYAPNAFSPNGDNKNNVYLVFGKGIKELRLRIYNRWGEKVFESTDINEGWDGTYKGAPQPVGIYVFEAQAIFYNGKMKREKGSLTLIR